MSSIDPLEHPLWSSAAAVRSATPTAGAAGANGLDVRATRLLARAQRWLDKGETAFAAQSLREALQTHPDHPDLLRLLALTQHQQARYADAIALLERARTLRPGDASIENNLGSALGQSGDLEGAVAAFRRASEAAPDLAASWFNLGKAQDALRQTEAARAAFERTVEIEPAHVPARVMLAETLKTLGRLDEAESEFRRALEADADSIEAWSGLVATRPRAITSSDLDTLRRLYRDGRCTDHGRVLAGTACMLALEAHGHYDEAFEVGREVNALQRRHVRWDAAAASRQFDAISDAFAQPHATADDPQLGAEVIFLVGMPRSGSTVTEQILAAHSQVQSAGEIGDVQAVLDEESRRRGIPFPDWVGSASAADWTRLGRAYLERTAHWRHSKPRSTDKNLQNWMVIGALHAMLPGAKIVDCRRDPLETCWSCFKHQFTIDMPFTHDFAELASYWHDYDRTMHRWQALYPGRIRKQVHEDLTAAPEAGIRALLSDCGLEFEPACLRFHETTHPVHTVSAAQVREPLRKDTARAGRYGNLLDPLRDRLAAQQR